MLPEMQLLKIIPHVNETMKYLTNAVRIIEVSIEKENESQLLSHSKYKKFKLCHTAS